MTLCSKASGLPSASHKLSRANSHAQARGSGQTRPTNVSPTSSFTPFIASLPCGYYARRAGSILPESWQIPISWQCMAVKSFCDQQDRLGAWNSTIPSTGVLPPSRQAVLRVSENRRCRFCNADRKLSGERFGALRRVSYSGKP